MHYGSCLCGAVTLQITGDLAPPVACHCTQCRKQSGHYWAAADVPRDQLSISGAEHLKYYAASEGVRRGFCDTCGSFLLWDKSGDANIDVAMGAFDGKTDTKLSKHIFVTDKGDYYDIADGLPQEG
jgi:hypothetical protein